MERVGYISYSESGAAGADQGPAGWVFGQDGKKQNVSLWSGTDYSLGSVAKKLPPWPTVLEALSVQIYDVTAAPGYPLVGFWCEFGVLLDDSTYMPIHAGYTDDAGRIRWTGRVHSHKGFILVFGNNTVNAADSVMTRFQALYTEEAVVLPWR